MPRRRTESGGCPRCGGQASVVVDEDDYAWLIGDRYESSCGHCGAGLLWSFKDVGDWSAWAPIERRHRIRLRPDPEPGPGPPPQGGPMPGDGPTA